MLIRLQAEIVSFDRGGSFEPGDYTLVPMPPAAHLGVAATGAKPHRFGNVREGAQFQHERLNR
jgi:hypothetical protein